MAGDEYRVRRGFFSRLPAWSKACLMKAWFAGAVFYFIGWGLFIQTSDQLDITLALGLALGLVTDLLINRALIFMERRELEYRPFIFCYSKRFFSIPVNVAYGVILAFCVSYTYHFINLAAQQWSGSPPGAIVLGGEPILYGLFFMGYDMLFVFIKNLIRRGAKGEK